MRVIPVIDLLGGQVVRGVGGRREEYRPIESTIVDSAEPGAVASALVKRFKSKEIYVADLDAIMHGISDIDSWLAIGATGCSLLLDAGIATAEDADEIWEVLEGQTAGSEFVIGLESLERFSELEIMDSIGVPIERSYLSIDLRSGAPLARDPELRRLTPAQIVDQASYLGILQFILLDLADVGTGQGTSTLPLLKQLTEQFPDFHFIAGGGVRGPDDLRSLQAAGAEGALVASALHDGRLSPADCRAFE